MRPSIAIVFSGLGGCFVEPSVSPSGGTSQSGEPGSPDTTGGSTSGNVTTSASAQTASASAETSGPATASASAATGGSGLVTDADADADSTTGDGSSTSSGLAASFPLELSGWEITRALPDDENCLGREISSGDSVWALRMDAQVSASFGNIGGFGASTTCWIDGLRLGCNRFPLAGFEAAFSTLHLDATEVVDDEIAAMVGTQIVESQLTDASTCRVEIDIELRRAQASVPASLDCAAEESLAAPSSGDGSLIVVRNNRTEDFVIYVLDTDGARQLGFTFEPGSMFVFDEFEGTPLVLADRRGQCRQIHLAAAGLTLIE